jgi:hypothetical protein
MDELRLDEGVCFFTLIPSDDNPFVRDIKKFRESHNWFGVIHPNGYAVVPFKIVFRSLFPKTVEEIGTFRRVMALKIRQLLTQGAQYVLDNDPPTHHVEDWLEVVRGTAVAMVEKNCIARVKMGGIIETIISVVISELIAYMQAWQEKYGYIISIERIDPPAILLGTVNDETHLSRFKQRLHDGDIQMSAYKWDVGLSMKREFVWRHPWYSFVEKLM